MPVHVINRQSIVKIDTRSLARKLQAVLDYRLDGPVSVNLVLTDDAGITELNRRFLGHDHPTDVIAFADLQTEPGKKVPLLGEVVVSVQTAKREGPRHHNTPRRELLLYAVHGILHLTGLDDLTPAQRRTMRRHEHRLMSLLDRPRMPRPIRH